MADGKAYTEIALASGKSGGSSHPGGLHGFSCHSHPPYKETSAIKAPASYLGHSCIVTAVSKTGDTWEGDLSVLDTHRHK